MTKESTSAAPERMSARVELDAAMLWAVGYLPFLGLTAALSGHRALPRCGLRNGEDRGRMLGLDRRISRHLIPVHLLAAGVGLEGVEHQFAGLGRPRLRLCLELVRTDAAAVSGGPGDLETTVSSCSPNISMVIEVTVAVEEPSTSAPVWSVPT